MSRLKILTWHVHGSYLWYLSHVPHDFYLPVKTGRPFGYAGRTASYPWPDNIIEVPAEKVRDLEFDCILYQAHENWQTDQHEILSEEQKRRSGRIFLEHNTPRISLTEQRHTVDDPNVLLVHVTNYNEMIWDNGRTPTLVIEHGVKVPEEVQSTYENERGLAVINNIASRGRRLGWDVLQQLRKEVPIDLVGMGWRDAEGLGELPHADLPAFHARYRFHFSPVRHSSLALSLCEAMMIGQPVVGLATTELVTVIENGVSGYLDTSAENLIPFIKILLGDQSLARDLGRGARKTALERFSIDRFVRDWQDAFRRVAGGTTPVKRRGRVSSTKISNQKLNVAIISEHASPAARPGSVDCGGQNVYVGQVARNLARLGHKVDVFTRRDAPDLPAVAEWQDGVHIVHVDAGPAAFVRKEELYGYMPEFTSEMQRFCRSQPRAYDIAHANFWMSGEVACELKKSLGLPFVITFHALGRVRRIYQGVNDGFPEARLQVEERIVREGDHVIAECPQDREDLLKLYGAEPRRVSIVPCGIDTREVFPVDKRLARRYLGLDPDLPLFLQVGRMVPRKGVDLVIRGFARFMREGKRKANLLIVGGESDNADPLLTPEIGRLMAIVREEGVGDAVKFVGRRSRDELKFFYSAADVFLTTPWYEPFGITPLEAMACATPVIGTKVGGIKFSVVDGQTGYLIAPNDVGALAERLGRMDNNRREHAEMARRSLERVRRCFRWDQVSSQIAEIYQNIVVEKSAARSVARVLPGGPEALILTMQ